jgi:hypothetical protein
VSPFRAPVREPGRVDATNDEPFPCPRCQVTVAARFYGPCDECRAELRSTLGNAHRDVEREAFVPAMHVTPNAVALKD